jgi:hypothetical protein
LPFGAGWIVGAGVAVGAGVGGAVGERVIITPVADGVGEGDGEGVAVLSKGRISFESVSGSSTVKSGLNVHALSASASITNNPAARIVLLTLMLLTANTSRRSLSGVRLHQY